MGGGEDGGLEAVGEEWKERVEATLRRFTALVSRMG